MGDAVIAMAKTSVGEDPRVIELSVTDLADLIEKNCCPQLALYVDQHAGPWSHTEQPKLDELTEAADETTPLLQHDADLFERAVEQRFDAVDWQAVKPNSSCDARRWFSQLIETVAETGDAVAVAQLDLETIAPIGRIALTGRPDLLVVVPTEAGVRIHICDMKATWDEAPKYQVQTAIYSLILSQWLDRGPMTEVAVELTSVIISKETAIDQSLTQATLDAQAADVSHLRTYLRVLLAPNGRLDQLYRTLDPDRPTAVQFTRSKCMNCRLTSACHGKLAEEQSTALLGWPIATQQRVARDHGYETLADLASEADDPAAVPFTADDGTLTESLRSLRSTIDESPRQLLAQAKSLLSGIDPTHPAGLNRESASSIPRQPGGGYGGLPKEPVDQYLRLNFYLHVSHDHRFDRLCLLAGCRIVGREGDPISDLETIPPASVPTIPYPRTPPSQAMESVDLLERLQAAQETYDVFEREMLDTFAEALFDRMSADHIIHLYIYGEKGRKKLLEACQRHRQTSDAIAALADMLVCSPDVAGGNRDEQPMVSIIHRAVTNQMLLPTLNTGLLPVADHVADARSGAEDSKSIPTDWTYQGDRGTVNLREIFRFRLFEYAVPFEEGELRPDRTVTVDRPLENGYPTRLRGSNIPLDYIYGAIGPLTAQWPVTSTRDTQPPAEYLYHSAAAREHRITRDELHVLAHRMAREAARVERACPDRATLSKEPLSVGKPRDFRRDQAGERDD